MAKRTLFSKSFVQTSARSLTVAAGSWSSSERTKRTMLLKDAKPTNFSPLSRSFSAQSSAKATGSDEAKSFVENEIKKYPVVVFAYETCPYCMKAKQVLNKYKLGPKTYAVHDIDNHENLVAILDYLKQKTGVRTLPRVFVNGKCIGGGNETVSLDESGELGKMLSNAMPKNEATTS